MSIHATRKWLKQAVIGGLYQRPLCPFANKPWKQDKIKLISCDTDCEEVLMRSICHELSELFPLSLNSPSCTATPGVHITPETTLVVAPCLFLNDYRKMIHFSWRIMEYISTQSHLVEKVQVVNFHPKAVHSLYASTPLHHPDAEGGCCDFSIRSPHPTFHLLREQDVLAAVANSGYPQPELIPARNATVLRDIGVAECQRRFQTLCDDDDDGDGDGDRVPTSKWEEKKK